MGERPTEVRLLSEPDGALARTTFGQACTTPCMVTVARKEPFTVIFAKPGFQDQPVDVRPRVAPGGDSWFNSMFGNPEMELAPNPVIARLAPVPPPQPVRRKRAVRKKAG